MKPTLGNTHKNINLSALRHKQNNAETEQLTTMNVDIMEETSLLHLIFDKSPNAILITDATIKIVYANPAWEKLTGYTLEEVKSKNPKFLQSGKTPKSVLKNILAALKQDQYFISDAVINKRKDGTEFQIRAAFFPVGKDHKAIFYVQIEHDITEQKKLEESIRQLINLAPDAIFIADINGTYLDVNTEACRMLGRNRNDIIGKSIQDLIPKEDLPRLKESKKIMSKPGNAHKDEWMLKHKNGKYIPVEVNATILKDGRWIGFVREISKRKELERQKDAFIGIASHELKTPLASLSMYAQLLERRLQKDKKNNALASKMNQQINKLHNLIDDLLNVSKINSGTLTVQLKKFDINVCVRKVTTDLQQTTKTHTITVEEKIPNKVVGDENKIEEVLENLLTNAIKYSPNAQKVIVHLATKNKQAVVSVQDFGRGIAKKDIPNLFQRFYQTKMSQKGKTTGFGLGLYIAHEIIQKHNGKMWVESEIGKGSTFYFSLPLAEN